MLRLLTRAIPALLLLLPALLSSQEGSLTVSGLREVLEKSQNMTGELEDLTEVEIPPEIMRQAEEARRRFSEAQQAQVRLYGEQITRMLTGSGPSEITQGRPSEAPQSVLGPGEAVVVFVSSSVPLETLREYAADVEALADPQVFMALRGFVGGMKRARPTLEFLWRVLSGDPSCRPFEERCRLRNASFHIDPVLFRELGIEAVPAVAYVRGLDLREPSCSSEGELQAWVLYGDVSLEYALEVLSREAGSPTLEMLASRLRNRGFYAPN